MSYKCLVAEVKSIRTIESLDNLVLANVSGYQVLVGKDTQVGSIGLWFEQGGQLSPGFCVANDLIERKDSEGNRAGGYFSDSRKIKAKKFKGVISEGFFCGLDSLNYIPEFNKNELKVGDGFDMIKGHSICNKFITQATRRQQNNAKGASSSIEIPMFKKHIETEQFKHYVLSISEGSLITVTSKLHGTSGRTQLALVDTPLNLTKLQRWWYKLWNKPLSVIEWKKVSGTRNTILTDNNQGYQGDAGMRHAIADKINPQKGETYYYEIVGYQDTSRPIMNRHDTSKLSDKSFSKKYGNPMTYSYGCEEGENDFYIYRVTLTNENNHTVELSYFDMVKRCHELGLKVVPFLDQFIYDGNPDKLRDRVDKLVNGTNGNSAVESVLDSRHIEEGVVLRVDSIYGSNWMKAKNSYFTFMENISKDDPSSIDIEEAS